LEDIPAVDGLDAKDGLARVAGNRKLYVKLLRQFVEQQGRALEEISAALARGEASVAERLAHTLKGVAGNIGARDVQAAAGVVEKRIREKADGADLDAARQQAAGVLDPLIRQLRTALGSSVVETATPASAAAIEPGKAREAAETLRALLAEFDPAAADCIEANRAALRSLFNDESWPKFEQSVQGYAFAEAQSQLDEVLKNLRPG
jgi:two-component system sensor histidine kinase/response regulator